MQMYLTNTSAVNIHLNRYAFICCLLLTFIISYNPMKIKC